MIFATRIVLLAFCALCFAASVGSNTERRGYMNLTGAAVAAVLLLVSFRLT